MDARVHVDEAAYFGKAIASCAVLACYCKYVSQMALLPGPKSLCLIEAQRTAQNFADIGVGENERETFKERAG